MQTIREAILFSANLRLSNRHHHRHHDQDMAKSVDQVITRLGLEGVQDMKIGSSERGGEYISKALKKMVTIAVDDQ